MLLGSPLDVSQSVFIFCYLFIYLLSNGLSDIWKFQSFAFFLLAATNKHYDSLDSSTTTVAYWKTNVYIGIYIGDYRHNNVWLVD